MTDQASGVTVGVSMRPTNRRAERPARCRASGGGGSRRYASTTSHRGASARVTGLRASLARRRA